MSTPLGPGFFIFFHGLEEGAERVFVNAPGVFAGSDVYHVAGAFAQNCVASGFTSPPVFRRTLFNRLGSRGLQCGN